MLVPWFSKFWISLVLSDPKPKYTLWTEKHAFLQASRRGTAGI